MLQVRLLPVTIFVAALMFVTRANDIWRGAVSGDVASTAMAKDDIPQPPAHAGTTPLKSIHLPPQLAAAEADKPPANDGTRATAEPPRAAAPETPDPASLSHTEIELLQKLSERREGLEQRSRELDMREGLLKAAEARIDKKIGELKDLQTSIDALLKKYNEQEEAKMASLVKIYENMKPKDAARIFEQLDMPVLLDVVERMSERKIAPILAEMVPAKAKGVTAELAQRRQMPPPGTQPAAKGG